MWVPWAVAEAFVGIVHWLAAEGSEVSGGSAAGGTWGGPTIVGSLRTHVRRWLVAPLGLGPLVASLDYLLQVLPSLGSQERQKT